MGIDIVTELLYNMQMFWMYICLFYWMLVFCFFCEKLSVPTHHRHTIANTNWSCRAHFLHARLLLIQIQTHYHCMLVIVICKDPYSRGDFKATTVILGFNSRISASNQVEFEPRFWFLSKICYLNWKSTVFGMYRVVITTSGID